MKKKLDITSLIGLPLAIVLVVVVGIALTKDTTTEPVTYVFNIGNIGAFFDPPSLAIVVGGTFAALMISFPLEQFAKIPKHIMLSFMPKTYNPGVYIETLAECAKKARINGLLALEEDVSTMDDPFMKNAMMMVVDSVDPEKVKAQIDGWLDALDERHATDRSFYEKGAALGPAFGMIGTLVGLINMLGSLTDIATVGPNMAVALVTTFYGSVMANIFFTPLANIMTVRHEQEYLCMTLVREGVEAIQAGENPKFMQERLTNMLPAYQRAKLGLSEDGDGGGDKKSKKKGK